MFSLRPDALGFENVDMKITKGGTPKVSKSDYPEMRVRLGSMTDCCRIHRLTSEIKRATKARRVTQ